MLEVVVSNCSEGSLSGELNEMLEDGGISERGTFSDRHFANLRLIVADGIMRQMENFQYSCSLTVQQSNERNFHIESGFRSHHWSHRRSQSLKIPENSRLI